MVIEVCSSQRDLCGEAPLWDADSGRLAWVDTERGLLHHLHAETGETQSQDLGAPLIFAVPTRSGGTVVGHRHTVDVIAPDGSRRRLADVGDDPDMCLQDGKCDTRGRLVFGQLAQSRALGTTTLFSLTGHGHLRALKTHVSLANGLEWNAAGDRFFHVDSDMQNIEVYDYDPDTGDVSHGRVFASIPLWEGLPDGICLDTEGGVWVALFGGSEVRRYDADGRISERIALPATNVTSVAFGGDDLQTLYVTSASLWLPEGADEELAGALFALRPGATGLVQNRFDA